MDILPIAPSCTEKPPELWTAVLLAGDRPGGDPLARAFGVRSKSLVPIGGKPMLAHVIDTLLDHPNVGAIIVLSQAPEALFEDAALIRYHCNPRVRLAKSNGSIARSISDTLRANVTDWPVLVTTSDHVLLDRRMIDWFMAEACVCDVAVGMVNRQVAGQEHLDQGRTWIPFRDVQITGANLFAFRSARVYSGLDYWQRLETHRKRPWRMAWEIGPALLVLFLLRRLSLTDAFARIGEKLGFTASPVQIPFARAGVDVDKAADHTLVEGLLSAS